MNRYYSLSRPIDIGCYPNWNGMGNNKVLTVHNFDQRTKIDGLPRAAWGYVEYEYPLKAHDMIEYELFKAIGE